MGGSTACFCPGKVKNFSPGSRGFPSYFFPDRATFVFFFVALCTLLSPRPLRCPFFRRICAPDALKFAPLCRIAVIRVPLFPHSQCGGFFLCFALNFPQLLRCRFFRSASHPRHNRVYPASWVRGASPFNFPPVVPDFSPAAAQLFFSLEQSAPCSLGISPLLTPHPSKCNLVGHPHHILIP